MKKYTFDEIKSEELMDRNDNVYMIYVKDTDNTYGYYVHSGTYQELQKLYYKVNHGDLSFIYWLYKSQDLKTAPYIN